MAKPSEVLEFWYGDQSKPSGDVIQGNIRRWFAGGEEMDRAIRDRFAADVDAAIEGGLEDWVADPTGRGRLAVILLLDQFTRGLYRNQARMYAGDARAQRLALEALDAGLDRGMRAEERMFLIMPLLHAEDPALQARNAKEVDRLAADFPELKMFAMSQEQAQKYTDIIRRFGRFPHRN